LTQWHCARCGALVFCFPLGSEQARREFSIKGAAGGIAELRKLDDTNGKTSFFSARIETGES
jgi:hypothetical protein